jgi:hypothetical protein
MIRALSSLHDIHEENQSVLQKRQIELTKLQELAQRIQSLQTVKSDTIHSLWKELWDELLNESAPERFLLPD